MTVHAPIQADFRYPGPVEDGAGFALSVSIYADRGHLRETLREDGRATDNRAALYRADDRGRSV